MSEPWLERWKEGRIGWHESTGNQSLQRHWHATDRRVLVPLCGKSPDLLWLEEQGNDVLGVELSDIAARAFFEEHDIAFETSGEKLVRYEAIDRRIEIVCGDYFEYVDETFDACYDRGALIALPRSARPAYAAHTASLLSPNAYQLLISLEYDQDLVAGPPYSIHSDELLSYWPNLQRVSEHDDTDNLPPKFHQAGLDEVLEVVWRSE
jgi:thiopurine S-methyltransferase